MHTLHVLYHNCIIHPIIGICYALRLERLGNKIHGTF